MRPPAVHHPSSPLLRIVPLRQVAAVGRSVRSVEMSATGSGGCGPGPGAASGPGTGASNPRKFSEKIALHTQRQAEETAAFQEVMMDITSTRVSESVSVCEAAAEVTTLPASPGEERPFRTRRLPPAPGTKGRHVRYRFLNRTAHGSLAKCEGLTRRSRPFPIRR